MNRLPIHKLLLIFIPLIALAFSQNLYAESEETYKGLKIFSSVLEEIENNYVDEVNAEDLIEKSIQGMLRGLDPHSSFMPPEAFEELQIDSKGEFGGIGIVISIKNNFLTVVSPIDGTPAAKAGIKAEDIIIKVDGETTQDMELWQAVKKMRGKKGTPVVITIMRQDEPDPIEVTLVRDVIPIYSVKYVDIKPGYAYVWITNFRDNTSEDLKEAIADLQSDDPLKGLILDLRDNPGGLLTQAVEVCDQFLDKGTIVSIKGRHGAHENSFEANPNESNNDFPIVVLINSGSASASEIVAGALQDHKRALILGTTSFGKGSVQTVKPVRDGYGLKYTIARYYTPSGRSIQARGIVPDITLKKKIYDPKAEVYEETYLKEKDLVNHLEAEPPAKKKKKHKKSKHSKLVPEELLTDNQISRAYEILISYDIFKNIDKSVKND